MMQFDKNVVFGFGFFFFILMIFYCFNKTICCFFIEFSFQLSAINYMWFSIIMFNTFFVFLFQFLFRANASYFSHYFYKFLLYFFFCNCISIFLLLVNFLKRFRNRGFYSLNFLMEFFPFIKFIYFCFSVLKQTKFTFFYSCF